MDSPAKTRRRFRRAPLAAAVLLGPLTTIGVAWASAAWLPVDDGRGTVALDGGHLQPWLIRLDRVSATRVIWFEKGRIWGRPMTTRGPSRVLGDGMINAMSCWSFAIQTRGDPDYRRGEIVLPEPMQALIARSNPQVCWGVARDQRGWPPAGTHGPDHRHARSGGAGTAHGPGQHHVDRPAPTAQEPGDRARSSARADLGRPGRGFGVLCRILVAGAGGRRAWLPVPRCLLLFSCPEALICHLQIACEHLLS